MYSDIVTEVSQALTYQWLSCRKYLVALFFLIFLGSLGLYHPVIECSDCRILLFFFSFSCWYHQCCEGEFVRILSNSLYVPFLLRVKGFTAISKKKKTFFGLQLLRVDEGHLPKWVYGSILSYGCDHSVLLALEPDYRPLGCIPICTNTYDLVCFSRNVLSYPTLPCRYCCALLLGLESHSCDIYKKNFVIYEWRFFLLK